MAEVQESGPILDLNFTNEMHIASRVDGVGIAGDYTGNGFALSLPSGSDVATIGPGYAQVGAHGYRVPSSQVQDIEIPASTNSAAGRTDLIVLRYQASWDEEAPGPVRVHRIPGVEGSGSRPSPDSTFGVGDTVLDLPLYAITRVEGDTLDQASVTDLRIWKGQTLRVPAGSPLYAAPLASRLVRDGSIYRRDLAGGSAAWVLESSPPVTLTGTSATANPSDPTNGNTSRGWLRRGGSRMIRDGQWRWLHMESYKGSGGRLTSVQSSGAHADQHLAGLHAQDRPPVIVSASARVVDINGSTSWAGAHVTSGGGIYLNSWAPGITIGPAGPDPTVIIDAVWRVS